MKKTVPFLFLAIIFGAAGWYFFTQEPETIQELPPPGVPTAKPVESLATAETQLEDRAAYQQTETETEPEPVSFPEPLPPLSESDTELKQALGGLVGSDPLAGFLIKNEVISRFVVVVDSLTSKQVPGQINPIKPAADKFMVVKGSDTVVMSGENFARYDAYVEMMKEVDSTGLVTLYRRYYPLLQQAWEENGGEGSFNDRMVEVIDHLLETPDVPGPVYLTKPEAVYLFEDPALEGLDAGQKILVRMGSFNAAVVKEKLVEIRANLSP
jgi:hypothetical protein